MAAKGNCYENALAERINGILKGEFNLDTKFKTKQQSIQAVQQSVYIYNTHRPHWSLKLRTPQPPTDHKLMSNLSTYFRTRQFIECRTPNFEFRTTL